MDETDGFFSAESEQKRKSEHHRTHDHFTAGKHNIEI